MKLKSICGQCRSYDCAIFIARQCPLPLCDLRFRQESRHVSLYKNQKIMEKKSIRTQKKKRTDEKFVDSY